ncbi:hypothetical protein DPEC_G00282240 [Dallia pectoralis]|uniref:Uncharacterized protein n=1 Tax=Dallia pectoralis TaxID=75939 RepID=A0ACC2FN04_DALPE|nr:hypothetical protein DPEC_G00282240 [Dallia pectoralis]
MSDHNYNLSDLHEACGESDIEEEMDAKQHSCKKDKINKDHTSVKQPDPKKLRHQREVEDTTTDSVILQALTKKIDEQTELLKSFDRRIEANETAIKDNREEICVLRGKMEILQKENSLLKEVCAEQTRYKRRW